MMTEKILPCPFCGSKPDFPEAKDVYGTYYEYGCNDCCLATDSLSIIDCFDRPRDHVHDAWNGDTHQYGLEYIEVARKQAIEGWNSRYKQKNNYNDEIDRDIVKVYKTEEWFEEMSECLFFSFATFEEYPEVYAGNPDDEDFDADQWTHFIILDFNDIIHQVKARG